MSEKLVVPGGPITPQQAKTKIEAYKNFLNAPENENIKSQTERVEFDRKSLSNWLYGLNDQIDLVQVYFAMEEDLQDGLKPKFTVVLWHSNAGGGDFTDPPYNIGARRPFE